MERKPSFMSICSSSSFLTPKTDKPDYLPSWVAHSTPEKPSRLRLRSIISHCLYRRVLLWAIGCLFFITLVLLKAKEHGTIISTDSFRFGSSSGGGNTAVDGGVLNDVIPDVVHTPSEIHPTPVAIDVAVDTPAGEFPQMQPEHQSPTGPVQELQSEQKTEPGKPEVEQQPEVQEQPPLEMSQEEGSDQQPIQQQEHLAEEQPHEEEQAPQEVPPKFDGPHWLQYPHLNGYYFGLKTLVSKAKHEPEYPRPNFKAPIASAAMLPPSTNTAENVLPTPTPYNPYPDFTAAAYKATHGNVVECTLDAEGHVPVPDLYAYNGLPQYHPDPTFGSYDMFGLRDDVCFDRFGRFGPYGLGYSWDKGGTGEGVDTEHGGSEAVWAKSGFVDYALVNWGAAQRRCSLQNQHRFVTFDDAEKAAKAFSTTTTTTTPTKKIDRKAVIIRTYAGFEWTHHSVLNLRAMISELALKSGGEYTVHLLLHVHDESAPIWADQKTVQKILDDEVPDEFHGLVTLWSEAQMRLYYPGNWDEPGPLSNPSGQSIHGVYRSAHMPMQVFAQQHPEYDHFWNWEMDMRYLGSYYELFDRLGAWADRQPRKMIWERSSKYYIPAVHGSWENFTALVEQETAASNKPPVFGQVHFPGWRKVRSEEQDISPLPKDCTPDADPWQCGVGEPADLISLNPLFDAENSGWVFSNDVTGYPQGVHPPRRSSIITASRLSRRLLETMHEETWRHHHSMFSEMFPASAALHHGLKAVYAPHPSYLDRGWEYSAIDDAFNGGQDRTTGGRGSPFDLQNEHNHKGTSWYYNSEFAGLLWRRWLGYAQPDGRGDNGGKAGEGDLRGGREEEEQESSSGRMCLRQMLFHPIKWENPSERGH